MLKKPTLIASRHIHSGRIIDVSTETLLYANGREYDLDFVRHPGAAAVVAVDSSERVCLVRQYRHGITDFLWEIPAGKLDPGEPPQVCAIRELAEETGVSAQRWTAMGQYLPAPGIFNEVIHLYLARDLIVGPPAPDADEDLEVQWLPMTDAMAKIVSGEWNDGKTALALWRAQYHLHL
jgi:8-oxo-dGTP pyrophosphatase MutT (NUDIX family)